MRNDVIAIACATLLILSGCHKRVRNVSPPVPSGSNSARSALDEADRAYNSGGYDEASRTYENYLRLYPLATERDQVLFRLGLAYALRTTPDWQRASSAFRQIVEGFPASPFKVPANLILSLHSELDQLNSGTQQRDQRIKQLTLELDRLKRIDADRRKHP